MNSQQQRILGRLLADLEKTLAQKSDPVTIQQILETHMGAIEDNGLRSAVDNAANKMDECRFTMSESDGEAATIQVVSTLVNQVRGMLR